jgi:hypothetical protein
MLPRELIVWLQILRKSPINMCTICTILHLLIIPNRLICQNRIEIVQSRLPRSTSPTTLAPCVAFLRNPHRRRAYSHTDAVCRDRPIAPNTTENTQWRVVCNSSQCTSHTNTRPRYRTLRQWMESVHLVEAARAVRLTARLLACVGDESVRSIPSFLFHSLQSRPNHSVIRRSNRAVARCVAAREEGQWQLCVANCAPTNDS